MENRKKDHIELAFKSQISSAANDTRFWYEPMLSAHPVEPLKDSIPFLGKVLRTPIWVSSMTGGTEWAGKINTNLAMACREFGMGMGLGSCRIILEDQTCFNDFNMRKHIGDDLPFWANLGIAQVEKLLTLGKESLITDLVKRLEADGLIVHVNPLQEWLQPEGDRFSDKPIDTVKRLIDKTKLPLIVKEVGQGMGPASLHELLKLPLEAIEFASFGGTNFAQLELLRAKESDREYFAPISFLGQTALEMTDLLNSLLGRSSEVLCKSVIVSGGIKNFLDGYYLIQRIKLPAIYGQASTMLKYAKDGYEPLHYFLGYQVKGLAMAKAYLKIRD